MPCIVALTFIILAHYLPQTTPLVRRRYMECVRGYVVQTLALARRPSHVRMGAGSPFLTFTGSSHRLHPNNIFTMFSFLAPGYDVGDVSSGIDWTYVWFRHSEVTQVEVHDRPDGIHYCIILGLELSLGVFLRVERQLTNGNLDYTWQRRLRTTGRVSAVCAISPCHFFRIIVQSLLLKFWRMRDWCMLEQRARVAAAVTQP